MFQSGFLTAPFRPLESRFFSFLLFFFLSPHKPNWLMGGLLGCEGRLSGTVFGVVIPGVHSYIFSAGFRLASPSLSCLVLSKDRTGLCLFFFLNAQNMSPSRCFLGMALPFEPFYYVSIKWSFQIFPVGGCLIICELRTPRQKSPGH